MSPFQILGLRHDADEPAIKRTYARLLKQHRPDEDPVGFQRINEAFQACIAHARYAVTVGEDCDDEAEYIDQDATSDAVPDARFVPGADAFTEIVADHEPAGNDDGDLPATTPLTWPTDAGPGPGEDADARETISFDLGAFVDELLQRDGDKPEALQVWLLGHPALYSLELKEAVMSPLVQQLLQRPTRLSTQGLAVVLDFFHLDTVHSGTFWLDHASEALRRNSLAAAHFQDFFARHTKSEWQTRRPGGRAELVDRLMLRELLQPFNLLRRGFFCFVPLLPSRVASMLHQLRSVDADYANQFIHTDSAAFWERAADHDRIDWRRLLIVLPRIAVAAIVFGAMATSPSVAYTLEVMARNAAWFGGIWLVYAVFDVGRRWFDRWRHRHPTIHVRSYVAVFLLAAAAGVTAFLEPAMSIFLYFAAVWAVVVNPPQAARRHALLASFLGAVFFITVTAHTGLLLTNVGLSVVLSANGALLVVIAHDVAYAWRHDITVFEARENKGWLVWFNIAYAVGIVAQWLPFFPGN